MKKEIKGIVLLLIVLLVCGCGGTHKNTTGRKDYSASRVALNCYYEDASDVKTTKTYADFIFNTKEYKTIIYYKVEYTYKEKVTDAKYKEIMDQIGTVMCVETDACKKDHVELGTTVYGFETIVDRKENQVIITYYKNYGEKNKVSDNFIEKTKKEYIKNGYKCQ